MFRIECFVDDKKLPKTLWALRAIGVYNVDAQPVTNERKANGAVRAKHGPGQLLQLLSAHLAKRKLKEVTPQDLRTFCENEGMLPKSYSNLLRDAKDKGLLRQIGTEWRYAVVKPKSKTKGATK